MVSDYFTKYGSLHPLKKATAPLIEKFLEDQVFLIRAPQILACDNGVQFTGDVFRRLAERAEAGKGKKGWLANLKKLPPRLQVRYPHEGILVEIGDLSISQEYEGTVEFAPEPARDCSLVELLEERVFGMLEKYTEDTFLAEMNHRAGNGLAVRQMVMMSWAEELEGGELSHTDTMLMESELDLCLVRIYCAKDGAQENKRVETPWMNKSETEQHVLSEVDENVAITPRKARRKRESYIKFAARMEAANNGGTPTLSALLTEPPFLSH
ncbi:hypothetical protein JTB14_018673 [Gonioctena quinquepunctata]|nr:hypothetical protein JTB14_018673 [Gonioctena quinquepunctata]